MTRRLASAVLALAAARAVVAGDALEPNGRSLNGRAGVPAVHGSANAGRVGGEVADRVSLEGTEFVARTAHGEARGKDFVGAEFDASLADGRPLTLRIDAIEPSARPGEADVLLYVVSYPAARGRGFLCGVDAKGEPVRAIPLKGHWEEREGVPGGGAKVDAGDFTFACEGFVLAKCVHAGYKPWARSTCRQGQPRCVAGVDLEPYHRACVRLYRADYCGDGTSYTRDGTPINLYDAIGIQSDDADWPFEAEWTASGARCARRKRIAENPTPPCWERLQKPDCGAPEHFATGTLLMNEDGPRTPASDHR